MNQSEFIRAVAEGSEQTVTATKAVVEAAIATLGAQMRAGDEVRLSGLGTFKGVDKEARTGRNPRTGEDVEIEAKRVPHFKPSTPLKELVNTPVRRKKR